MKLGLGQFAQHARYTDLRRRLDPRAVLNHYGAENAYEVEGRDGTVEVIHSCILDRVSRHHRNGDASPSAALNLTTGNYICYLWWGGDLIHLIMKMEDKTSFEEVLPLLGRFVGDATAEPDAFLDQTARVLAAATAGQAHSGYDINPPAYSDRLLTPWAFVHPYLHERGIDSGTASRLAVGWREDDNRIILPHFWRGHLVGWQARAVPDRPGQWPGSAEQRPKYRSSPGFPKADTLYHAGGREGRPLPADAVVVESPFSVVKAEALAVPGVVATFGAKISAAQTAMLRGCARVTVWTDGDEPGLSAQRRLTECLYRHTEVRVVTPDEGRDLADCAHADEVAAKLDAAEPAVVALARYGTGRPGRRH